MVKKQDRDRKKGKGQDYWQSYSDMMAALLLIFVLLIAGSMYQFGQQQQALKERESEYAELQTQLDRILGVKKDIIQALSDEFQLSGISVNIDEGTGDITFDSNILFAYNAYDLSKEGKKGLEDFVPAYLSVLLAPENLVNISEIVIEGHTDTAGDYDYNLKLSQERALSVAEYCMETVKKNGGKEQLKHLRAIMTANGRSESNPVYKNNGEVDMDASRRVVFKFRLKDEAMIEEMRNILKQKG